MVSELNFKEVNVTNGVGNPVVHFMRQTRWVCILGFAIGGVGCYLARRWIISWITKGSGTTEKGNDVAQSTLKTGSFASSKQPGLNDGPTRLGKNTPEEKPTQAPSSINLGGLEDDLTPAAFQELLAINSEIVRIQDQFREADKKQDRTLKTELNGKYDEKIKEKISLVIKYIPKGMKRFIAMGLPGKIAPGITFYHATRSETMLGSILVGGVKTTTTKSAEAGSNNFTAPELGQGLYLSQAGGYAGEGYTYVLVVQTTKEVSTIRIEYISSFMKKEHYRQLELTEEEVREGITYFEENYAVIQREGLAPRDEEIVLRNLQNSFKPLSTGRWDENHSCWNCSPKFIDSQTLHDQWKSREVISQPSISEYQVIKEIDNQGRCIIRDQATSETLFFKPFRQNQTEVVIASEIAASSFANHILGSLVPAAKRMRLQGKDGVAQRAINFSQSYLPGAIGKAGEVEGNCFNISRLTQEQKEQLFMHSLVDWVLSNTDVQPHNFGIEGANLVAFDKAQAFKYFNGSKVQSSRAQRGSGIESKLNRQQPDFNQLEESRVLHVHALLRDEMRKCKIKIDFESQRIQGAIDKIKALTKAEIGTYFGDYARLAFPDKQDLFIESVWDRCQDLPRAVAAFRKNCS